jgi:hypothetical protein
LWACPKERQRSTKIKNLYFDGEKSEETYVDKWYFIKNYPKKVEKKLPKEKINKRYELKNPELESCKLPLSIPYSKLDNNDEKFNLYSYEYDIKEIVLDNEGMKIKQGRIKENNPDKAAMKIREMYNEYEGNLSLKRVPWLVSVIEYQIELRG